MAELTSSNLLAGGIDPLQIVSEGDAADLVAAAVGKLTDRERTIVNARFGLEGESPKTLAEIKEIVGVNPERIRQIEQKALRKLRTYATASLAYAHSDEAGEDREEIIIQNAMTIAKSAARASAKQKREAQEWIAFREKQKLEEQRRNRGKLNEW